MIYLESAEFNLRRRLGNFFESRTKLIEAKSSMFPVPCVVFVDCDRFTGMGVVRCESDSPDKLDVIIENGNTWSYGVEFCSRIDNKKSWPKWAAKKMKVLTTDTQ